MRLSELSARLVPTLRGGDLTGVHVAINTLCMWQHVLFPATVAEAFSAHVNAGTVGDFDVTELQADVITCAVITMDDYFGEAIGSVFPSFLFCAHTATEWAQWQEHVTRIAEHLIASIHAAPARGPYPQYASTDFGGKAREWETELMAAPAPQIDPLDVVAAATLSLRSARASLDAALTVGWHPQLTRYVILQLGDTIGALDDAHQDGWPTQPY